MSMNDEGREAARLIRESAERDLRVAIERAIDYSARMLSKADRAAVVEQTLRDLGYKAWVTA